MEIWKDVIGYEGKYQVSNFGNIKGIPRIVWNGRAFYQLKEKILKPGKNSEGYLIVILCDGKTTKTSRVNRLVAKAFIDNPNNNPVVNHKDSNKINNCLNNLEWCTYSENSMYVPVRNNKKSSKYKGVLFHKGCKYRPWGVRIKNTHIGYYPTEIEAAKAYNEEIVKHQGSFAYLNKF